MGIHSSKERKRNKSRRRLMKNWKHEQDYTATYGNHPHTDMDSSEYQCQGEPDHYVNICDGDEIDNDSVWVPRRNHEEIFIRNKVDDNMDSENYVAMSHIVEKETVLNGPDIDTYYTIKDRFSRPLSETDIKQPDESTIDCFKNTYLDLRISNDSPQRLHRYEEMVMIFQPLIVQNVIPRHIIPHLTFLDDPSRVHAIEARNPRSAVVYIIDELTKNNKDPGRWKQFIEALERSEYKYIAGILQGEKPVDHTYQRAYLKIITPVLRENIFPIELSETLWSVDVLSNEDKEEIQQVFNNFGQLCATDQLLDRVPRKHRYWYSHLTDALKKTGMEDAAKMLDIPELQNLSDSYLKPSKKLDTFTCEEYEEPIPVKGKECSTTDVINQEKNYSSQDVGYVKHNDVEEYYDDVSYNHASRRTSSVSVQSVMKNPAKCTEDDGANGSQNMSVPCIEIYIIDDSDETSLPSSQTVSHGLLDISNRRKHPPTARPAIAASYSDTYADYKDENYFLPPSPASQQFMLSRNLSDKPSEKCGEISKHKQTKQDLPRGRPLPPLPPGRLGKNNHPPVQSERTPIKHEENVPYRCNAHRLTHPPPIPSRNMCSLTDTRKVRSTHGSAMHHSNNVEVVVPKTPLKEIGSAPPFPVPTFDFPEQKQSKPVKKRPVPLPRTKTSLKMNNDIRNTEPKDFRNMDDEDSYEDVEENQSPVPDEDDKDDFFHKAADIKTFQTRKLAIKTRRLSKRHGNSMFERTAMKSKRQEFNQKMSRKVKNNPKRQNLWKTFQKLRKPKKHRSINKDETSSETDDNGVVPNSENERDESLSSRLQDDINEVHEVLNYYSEPFLDDKRKNTKAFGKTEIKKCRKDQEVLPKPNDNPKNKQDDLIEAFKKCHERHGLDQEGIKKDLPIPLSKKEIKPSVQNLLEEFIEQEDELVVLVQQEPVLKARLEIQDSINEKLKQKRDLVYKLDMKKKEAIALKEAPANEVFNDNTEVSDTYDDKDNITSARTLNSSKQIVTKPDIEITTLREIPEEVTIHNKADPESIEKDSAFYTYTSKL
ncbi:Interferon-induced helicase C domain-containing protein 1 [Mactra antiquata]